MPVTLHPEMFYTVVLHSRSDFERNWPVLGGLEIYKMGVFPSVAELGVVGRQIRSRPQKPVCESQFVCRLFA